YRIRATNSQGSSGPGPVLKIDTTPGPVAAPIAFATSVDLATGLSQLQVGWSRPTTGTTAVSYDMESCIVPAGKMTGCEPASAAWSAPSSMPVPATDPLRIHRTCPPGVATCMYRVRGHNARGGAGAWHAFSTEPWAPFAVAVAPGRAPGTVKVTF